MLWLAPLLIPTLTITEHQVRCVTVRKGDVVQSRCTIVSIPPKKSPKPLGKLTPPSQLKEIPSEPAPRELPELKEIPSEPVPDQHDDGEHSDDRSRSPAPLALAPTLAPALTPAPAPGLAPPTPSRPQPPAPSAPQGNSVSVELQVVALLNQARARMGLGRLAHDPRISAVARAHSRDMCARRYFSHSSPEGSQPWHRLKRAGVSFRAAAENIAVGYTTAAEVHQGWLNSPGHRANRLGAKYTRMGVGLVMCGGMPYWTELFTY